MVKIKHKCPYCGKVWAHIFVCSTPTDYPVACWTCVKMPHGLSYYVEEENEQEQIYDNTDGVW